MVCQKWVYFATPPKPSREKTFKIGTILEIVFSKKLLSFSGEGLGAQQKTIAFLFPKIRQKMWVCFATPQTFSRKPFKIDAILEMFNFPKHYCRFLEKAWGEQQKPITFLFSKIRQKMWVCFATPPKPSRENLSKFTQF